MIPFEEENVNAYRLMLRIEVALRECLRSSFEKQFGPRWQKQIPGDMLKKIRDAQTEAKRPQFNYLNLGPFYYLTLGELLPILQQNAGRPTAERFGGDGFIKQLENILGPRNALCHSRNASSVGLVAIDALYRQMETALTPEGLEKLLSEPNIGLPQDIAAKQMIPCLREAAKSVSELPATIKIPDNFDLAKTQYWWGEEALAGFDCVKVKTAVALIQEYNSLPQGIGSAAFRQRFTEEKNLKVTIENAITELEKVLL